MNLLMSGCLYSISN